MTKPFGVASDVHLHNWTAFAESTADGVNSRLRIILNELIRAAQQTLKSGGKRMVITGDLFHVRGSITPSVLNPTLDTFRQIIDMGIEEVDVLAGNHDLESKDSNALTNACEALSQLSEVMVVSATKIVDRNRAVYVPWYDNSDDLLAEINRAIGELPEPVGEYDLFIHAPVDDVLPNMPGHGINPDDLKNLGFRYVFSGHYHNHKEVRDGVFSVGATTHQTWGDVDSKAGFLLVNDRGVSYWPSEAPAFVDLSAATVTDDVEAWDLCSGNYVRVKLDQVTQSEVAEIKSWLIDDIGAKNCIIQATPKNKVVSRTRSSKGGTLRESVGDFVGSKNMTVEKKDVLAVCEDILTATAGVTV